MPFESGKPFGKYHKLLIPLVDLKAEAKLLVRPLQRAHAARYLTDAEYTAYFVLLFSYQRVFGSEIAARRTSRTRALVENLVGWLGRDNAVKPSELSLVLDSLQLKGVPRMIWQVLSRWLRGEIRLQLTSQPVTGAEMLSAMAAGFRYVTLDMDAALNGDPVAQTRDAFEFVLHDLGHAHAFFKKEYDPDGQVLFFRRLQDDMPTFEKYQRGDVQFAAALDYCLSDMNSHPMHLRQYIQGVIIELFLRMRRTSIALAEPNTWSEQRMHEFLATLNCLK